MTEGPSRSRRPPGRPRPPRSWSDYPPHALRDYAFIADGRRGALVGPRGDIVWMCAPRWDDPGVFSALIGGEGVYAVSPSEPSVWGGYYEDGTLIWRSRWVTSTTLVECHEALAMPADPHTAIVMRRIVALDKAVRLKVVFEPRHDFGREPLRELRLDDEGRWTARTGSLNLRWTGAARATRVGRHGLELDLRVPAGAHHDLLLEISDRPLGPPPQSDRLWEETREAWHREVPTFTRSVAPRDSRQAYAVLVGMTDPEGGVIAAATLGLPERAEAGRNYDYRYVWLRDQAYAGLAAGVHDPLPLLDVAVAVTTARVLEHGDQIAPAYRVDGRPLPKEQRLPLLGYPGGEVVVGNWVNQQFQLDSIGDILTLLAVAAAHDRLDDDGRQAMDVAARVIEKRWQQPDAGIWELRDGWWTQSRLSAVAGLRNAARQVGRPLTARLSGLADAILAEADKRCLRTDGVWRRAPDLDGTDASLVLPPVRGALPAEDPRTVATLAAVMDELAQDGYAYRFRTGGRPLGEDEGAFLLCGFTVALAHWHQSDAVQALGWFERTSSAGGSPGLLSEEYDVVQRQLRGNLPQSFVHAMLLETAQVLHGSPPDRS